MTCWTVFTECGSYLAYGNSPAKALADCPPPRGEAIVAIIRYQSVVTPGLTDFGLGFVAVRQTPRNVPAPTKKGRRK